MRSLFIALTLTLTTASFGQGLLFSSLPEVPKFLALEKIKPFVGESYLRHRNKEFNVWINIKYETEELKKLNAHLLNQNPNVYCDGEFELKRDKDDRQYISVKSISVCVDQEGWVVSHNVNSRLTPTEVQKKASELAKSIKDC